MRVPPSLLGPAVLASAVAGLAGCGGSGYQYVENDDLGVYARLPDGWAVYDEQALFPDDSERELEQRADRMWIRSFDASDDPSAEQSREPGTDEPTGTVQVVRLSNQAREQVSISALRGLGDPTNDPVALARENPSGAITVVSDEPVTFDGGYHGVRTVFGRAQGSDTTVHDRTVLLDSTSSVLFRFEVTCGDDCFFETHKDEIADIVDSWTIQEGGT